MPKDKPISDLLKAPLKIEQWPIDRLVPYIRNPRKNYGVVDKLVSAIKEFGFRIPIVAKSDGSVVDGHLRLKAAKKLGMAEVPVALADELTDAQVKAFRLLANRSVDWAEWDNDLLKLELDELREMNFDLELTGFELDEINEITGLDVSINGQCDPDDVPDVQEKEPPVSKTGDIWILGKHRLMCGDSTDAGSVSLLMVGQKADMVFTDPPYGMNLDTDYSVMKPTSRFAKGKFAVGGRKYEAGKVDDFQPDMIKAIFEIDANEVFLWGADYYSEILPDKNDGAWLVWDKRTNEESNYNLDKMYGSCFELCWSKKKHKREIVRIKWAGIFGTEQEPEKKRFHPTQKPVLLAKWFIDKYSKQGQTILDLFGGSGTTLIACEQTSRQCRMMELDPHYCDVIIKRWQDFTGQKAVNEASGKNFDDLKSEILNA